MSRVLWNSGVGQLAHWATSWLLVGYYGRVRLAVGRVDRGQS